MAQGPEEKCGLTGRSAGAERIQAAIESFNGLWQQKVWARFEHTPFGTGRPFSRGQLNELLREANFTPSGWADALFLPPSSAQAEVLADFVLVDKSERTLWVYSDGRVIRTIGGLQFGDAPQGHKRFQGDERTPEGRYTIDYGNPQSRFYLSLLGVNGNLTMVGAPADPLRVSAFSLIMGRRSLSGSNIGGIAETQEMLDFCGKHNITADVEVIPIQKVNEAYERLLKSDVKYRFCIDMASLKSQ